MITHPDKVHSDFAEDLKLKLLIAYRDSKAALDSYDYVSLVILAYDLDIKLPKKQISDPKIFNKKHKELKSEISSLKESPYWVWAHSTDDEKEEILHDFILSRGWTSQENKRKRARRSPGSHPGKSISQMKKSKILKKKD